MKIIREKFLLFSFAIFLSILFHVVLLVRLSGIHGFDFRGLFSDKTILVDLQPEKIQIPVTTKAVRSIASDKKNTEAVSVPTAPAKSIHEDKITPYETDEKDAGEKLEDSTDENDNAEAAKEAPADAGTADLLMYSRETFHYDLLWVGFHVGNAVLEAFNDDGDIRITSRAHSASFISTFYKVEDYAESRIVDGAAVSFRIRQHEGKYRSDKETLFDSASRKITFKNYLNNTKEEHEVAGSLPWDVISGFYYLRTQTLEVGKTVYINVFDSNKFFRAEVNVLRRESAQVPGIGEVNALVLKLALKSEGLFQSKGDIFIWLTDDERRIPVRVEAKAPVGHVTAELRVVETEE